MITEKAKKIFFTVCEGGSATAEEMKLLEEEEFVLPGGVLRCPKHGKKPAKGCPMCEALQAYNERMKEEAKPAKE